MKRCLVEWALASLLSQSAILEDKKMFLVSQMIMFYTLKNLADSFIHSSFYWLSRCHLLDDTTVDTTCHLLLTWLQVHVGKKWKYNKTRIQEGRGAVSFVLMLRAWAQRSIKSNPTCTVIGHCRPRQDTSASEPRSEWCRWTEWSLPWGEWKNNL